MITRGLSCDPVGFGHFGGGGGGGQITPLTPPGYGPELKQLVKIIITQA